MSAQDFQASITPQLPTPSHAVYRQTRQLAFVPFVFVLLFCFLSPKIIMAIIVSKEANILIELLDY
jgi:hypothetical protein